MAGNKITSYFTKTSTNSGSGGGSSSRTSRNLLSASSRSHDITRYLTDATTSSSSGNSGNQEISDLDSSVVERFEARVGFMPSP